MKKKTIQVLFTILLIYTISSSITNTNAVELNAMSYSDSIVPGETFEWKIRALDSEGEYMSYYAEYMYIGNTVLVEGDTIKLRVLEDPDTSTGIWYEFYVNNVKLNDSDPVYIFPLSVMYFFMGGDFLINPVTMTNSTGTYNLFELLYDDLKEEFEDETTSTVITNSLVTTTIDQTAEFDLSLKNGKFQIALSSNLYYHSIGPGGDESIESIDGSLKLVVNTQTGVVEELRYWVDFEMYEREGGIVQTDETSFFHFHMTSGGAFVIPFNWSYSVLGISSIAAVVFLTRRKK